MSSIWWLALFLTLCAGLILFFRRREAKSLTGNRSELQLELIYESIDQSLVSKESFFETWSAVGKAYGIDPRLIRPQDSFRELSALDSWALGEGQDQLEKWVQMTIPDSNCKPETVIELAQCVSRKRL